MRELKLFYFWLSLAVAYYTRICWKLAKTRYNLKSLNLNP